MPTPRETADTFAELFPSVYLRFHRRDAKRSELTGATRGVMLHLANTGPLTIGELAAHVGRAQSVVSELIEGMERRKLLERVRDPRDRRRTLVWLTDSGLARLDADRDVLSRELLAGATAHMTAPERAALLRGVSALLRAHAARTTPSERKKRTR